MNDVRKIDLYKFFTYWKEWIEIILLSFIYGIIISVTVYLNVFVMPAESYRGMVSWLSESVIINLSRMFLSFKKLATPFSSFSLECSVVPAVSVVVLVCVVVLVPVVVVRLASNSLSCNSANYTK
jgi:hypothetical protein